MTPEIEEAVQNAVRNAVHDAIRSIAANALMDKRRVKTLEDDLSRLQQQVNTSRSSQARQISAVESETARLGARIRRLAK